MNMVGPIIIAVGLLMIIIGQGIQSQVEEKCVLISRMKENPEIGFFQCSNSKTVEMRIIK